MKNELIEKEKRAMLFKKMNNMPLNCWRCGKEIDQTEMLLAQMHINKNWCFDCYNEIVGKYFYEVQKSGPTRVKNEDLEDTWFNAHIESEAKNG